MKIQMNITNTFKNEMTTCSTNNCLIACEGSILLFHSWEMYKITQVSYFVHCLLLLFKSLSSRLHSSNTDLSDLNVSGTSAMLFG